MSTLKVKLFGPWSKVKNLLNNLQPNLASIITSSQRSLADKLVRKVKAHLRNQDIPGWTPLSNNYADKKMGKYGHEDLLIASWTYYESIKSWRKDKIYYAGVPTGITYDNGLEVAKIADIHEKWSATPGKPYRPLWSYTLNEDLGGPQGVKKTLATLIATKLIAKGYPVNSIKI